jgi:DNA-binding LacI/PurR family transcriptional regulator
VLYLASSRRDAACASRLLRSRVRTVVHSEVSQWTGRPEQVRSDGYRQAMHRHGLDEAVAIAGTSYSEEGGYQAGRELLDRPGRSVLTSTAPQLIVRNTTGPPPH